jgi:predicted PurR-regulated permease PerM
VPAQNGTSDRQRYALGALVMTAVATLVWIALPMASGLLLGALVGFSVEPVYNRLRRKLSPAVSATICTGGATAIIAVVIFGMGYLFVDRGLKLLAKAPAFLSEGSPIRVLIDQWGARFHVSAGDVTNQIRGELDSMVSSAAQYAAGFVGMTLHLLLSLFFVSTTCYFVLRHWEKIAARAEVILPLHPRHTKKLFSRIRDVGSHVLIGTLFTGLAQGVLASIGFWVSGVPQPAVFGALTAFASLIPALGTLLVWVPVGVYLCLTGHVGMGILDLVYGTVVVVGVSDYVIRPRLVGDRDSVPSLLTFVALFGGIEVFGLMGLVVGPVLVTLAIALIRTYYEEMVTRDQEAKPQGA